MNLVIYPAIEEFERSPCRECSDARAEEPTFEEKVFVGCSHALSCNSLEDFKNMEGGRFEVQE